MPPHPPGIKLVLPVLFINGHSAAQHHGIAVMRVKAHAVCHCSEHNAAYCGVPVLQGEIPMTAGIVVFKVGKLARYGHTLKMTVALKQ